MRKAKMAKPGRKKNGHFKKNSPAAKRAGRKGGQITAKKNARCHTKKKTPAAKKTAQRSFKLR